MIGAFIIVLREVIEAGLIVGIVLAATRGVPGRAVYVSGGVLGGVAGAGIAVGPILGGVLTQWTWRAIFWVNIPVAVIALILIVVSRPVTLHRPARMDYRGLALIVPGVALSVFGFQQSAEWGWSNPATPGTISASPR